MASVVAVSPLLVRRYPKSGVTTLPSWVTELVGVPSEAPKEVSGALSVQTVQRSEFMLNVSYKSFRHLSIYRPGINAQATEQRRINLAGRSG